MTPGGGQPYRKCPYRRVRPDFEFVYRGGRRYKSARRPDDDHPPDVPPATHCVEPASRAGSFQPAISWIDFVRGAKLMASLPGLSRLDQDGTVPDYRDGRDK